GADQAAQQRRLAGTIAARERDRLSGTHLQIELVEDGVRPEGPAQAGDLEDRRAFGHAGDSPPFRQEVPTSPTARVHAQSNRRSGRTRQQIVARITNPKVVAATN